MASNRRGHVRWTFHDGNGMLGPNILVECGVVVSNVLTHQPNINVTRGVLDPWVTDKCGTIPCKQLPTVVRGWVRRGLEGGVLGGWVDRVG